jgi:flagellar basal body-associated protein FliL
MSNQHEQDQRDLASKETRFMWIAVAVVVVILLGGMGINMLVHKETSAGTVETGNPQ